MTDGKSTAPLPLSFVAEQMVAGMMRRLKAESGEEFGLHDAVLDLLQHHRGVGEEIGGELDLDALGASARREVDAGDPGRPIDRDWLVARAASAAAAAGRSVIAPVDVATPLLQAAEHALVEREEVGVGAGAEPGAEPGAPPQEELEEPAAAPSLPLGFLAEQMLAGLDREAGRSADSRAPSAWLIALSKDHPDLAADAAEGAIGDLEAAARRRVEAGPAELPLDPEQIVSAASEQARDAGCSVVTPADVAKAIVDLAQPEPEPPPEPSETAAKPTETAVTAPEPEPEVEPVQPEPEGEPEPIKPRVTTERPPRRAEERLIRVFISSTFRDMQAEREELVKRVFPQLRKLCEERGVTWGEVDLRWGITEQQTKRGEVLPICLEEIRRCRPYFIGILGERYGWVPHEYPPDLLEEQRWLKKHLEHSITELEILHGVLKDPEMADHAYFYLRDPDYVDSLPPDLQPDYREGPTDEEIEEYGPQEAEKRAEDRREKLEGLKARLRASDFPVREDYANPVELGELVLEDLTALIDQLYPEGEQPDPLDREAAEHQAFAATRAGVYVGRQAYIDRLNAHAGGDGEPLVVLGKSGSGKSALLANWALDYRAEHPDELMLMHFIGASPYSTDWRAMRRRVMGELQRHFDLEGEIPEDPGELRRAFANWLHRAAARGRVVLIFDALNQLEDREGAPDLVWLPPEMPENVRLVLSTLPGRPLDALEARGWPTLTVKPLRPDEREELIEKYLAQYGKTLAAERSEDIAAAPQAANPLYLRALLEELRVFGDYDTLGPRIGHYLDASTVPDLYAKILERYEEDYERERPELVEEAMSLLWAARRGLSEAELLELLGSDGEPLPQAHWAPLYLAAERSLISRAGLIGFSHYYLRQAVRERYLPTDGKRQAKHERLADYFAARDLGPRQIDELPWQLEQAESWQQLYGLLADLDFFRAAWEADEFEVKARWAQVEANADLRMVEAYQTVLDAPSHVDTDISQRLARFLIDAGHSTQALRLLNYLIEQYSERGPYENLAACLIDQAAILQVQGHLNEAIDLYRKVDRICRHLGDMRRLQTSLGNRGMILRTQGKLSAAMRLHEEQERICRELEDRHGLAKSLGSQAVVLRMRADPRGAMALLEKQERIYRELGDRTGLSDALGNQAVILDDAGEPAKAMTLYRSQEQICRRLGDKLGLQQSLGNQAVILKNQGEYGKAMDLHKKKEQICRELGFMDGVQRSLGNQALILRIQDDLDGAMALHREEEQICRELGNMEGLARSLTNQAACWAMVGRQRKALRLIQSAYQIAERHELTWMIGQIEQMRNILEG